MFVLKFSGIQNSFEPFLNRTTQIENDVFLVAKAVKIRSLKIVNAQIELPMYMTIFESPSHNKQNSNLLYLNNKTVQFLIYKSLGNLEKACMVFP